MAKYEIKYWFEWMCETPFWPNNKAAYELGSPISLDSLPLSDCLKADLKKLCIEHDNAIDWNDPSGPCPLTPNQKASFDNKAKSLYREVVEELGEEYSVIYAHDEFEGKNTIERLISSDEREYYTFMLEFIEALNLPNNYKCLITDLDHNIADYDLYMIFRKEYQLFTIEELLSILRKEDFQWNWGNISIFKNDISNMDILKYDLPKGYEFADSFMEYPIIQHPLAIMELMSFDSSELVFVTNDHQYYEIIKKLLPLAVENL